MAEFSANDGMQAHVLGVGRPGIGGPSAMSLSDIALHSKVTIRDSKGNIVYSNVKLWSLRDEIINTITEANKQAIAAGRKSYKQNPDGSLKLLELHKSGNSFVYGLQPVHKWIVLKKYRIEFADVQVTQNECGFSFTSDSATAKKNQTRGRQHTTYPISNIRKIKLPTTRLVLRKPLRCSKKAIRQSKRRYEKFTAEQLKKLSYRVALSQYPGFPHWKRQQKSSPIFWDDGSKRKNKLGKHAPIIKTGQYHE